MVDFVLFCLTFVLLHDRLGTAEFRCTNVTSVICHPFVAAICHITRLIDIFATLSSLCYIVHLLLQSLDTNQFDKQFFTYVVQCFDYDVLLKLISH